MAGGIRQEVVRSIHRKHNPTRRAPRTGVFPRACEIHLRDGRREICPRVSTLAFCRELLIVPPADIPLTELPPLRGGSVRGFARSFWRSWIPRKFTFLPAPSSENGERDAMSQRGKQGMSSSLEASSIMPPLPVRIGPPPSVLARASFRRHRLPARSLFLGATPRRHCAP